MTKHHFHKVLLFLLLLRPPPPLALDSCEGVIGVEVIMMVET
jgi:hypothetical protein